MGVEADGEGGGAQTTTWTTTYPTASNPYCARYLATLALLLGVAVLATASRSPTSTSNSNDTTTSNAANRTMDVYPDSVYVTGSGLTGLWYTLGRLSSSSYNTAACGDLRHCCQVYHCYSKGCLAVMAYLSKQGV